MNHGFISEQVIPKSLLKGGKLVMRMVDANWVDDLPDFEAQSKLGLETMNCVQFSFLNVLEIIARSYGVMLNLSDRFLYWASGCTVNGNTFSNCIYGFLKYWCCGEGLWPWLVAMSRAEYGKEPPDDIKAEAMKLSEQWELGQLVYVESDIDAMREALKATPLWACNHTHAFVIYAIDDRICAWDTYGSGKGSFPLDYVQHIEACYNVPFTPKQSLPQPVMPFVEETLYQLVEGIGGFFLFVKGVLYRDTEAKILASWTVRSGVKQPDGTYLFLGGKVGTLTLKDIAGVPLFNLKDEPVVLGLPV